jgi:hypothetical protein
VLCADTANAPDAGGFRNWRCIQDPNAEEGVGKCHYLLPAKRLNVYPSDVELVWFDRKELDNPSYAIYVAAYAFEPPGAVPLTVQQMCKWTMTATIGYAPYGYSRRAYGYYNAPPTTVLLD